MTTPVPYAMPSPFAILPGAVPLDVVESLARFVDTMIGHRAPPKAGEIEGRWYVNLLTMLKAKRVRSMQSVVGFLNATPIPDRVREILGEDIVVPLQGTTIRDYRPEWRSHPSQMHFDATVLGAGTPIVTVWIPLDPVGRTAPSLVMSTLPNWPRECWQRLVENTDADGMLVPGGGKNLVFSHEDLFARAAEEAAWPFVEPVLEPGDVMLFDQQRVHGTQLSIDSPTRRRSMEIRFCSAESATRIRRLNPDVVFGVLAKPNSSSS